MIDISKPNAATIPYQLRPHKAIERNLFITILKKIDRCSLINLSDYRYVGFGAAFLEDFKALHSEFGINDMDCMEYDPFAYTRQSFNNPYKFISLYNLSSTKYIAEGNFKQDKNQIVWLDFASPREIEQQLTDTELAAEKFSNRDIFKVTFNCSLSSYKSSHHLNFHAEPSDVLNSLKSNRVLNKYIPEKLTANDISYNFSGVIRAMSLRAINRGLAKTNDNLVFYHIASFVYADGQEMTTMTGIITNPHEIAPILSESGLESWEFYSGTPNRSELIPATRIEVPAMTVAERIEIDKHVPTSDIFTLASNLKFKYGKTEDEHLRLVEGYCRFYKYLPYYSKVIY